MQMEFACRVLVVEDEIGVRRSLIGKLRQIDLPLEVAGEADNAEQAYEMMKRDLPDIVLLDMRMPGMGGYRFLPILKERFPGVRVIILSGYSDFEYMRQSLQSGAIDYLLKPVIKEDLEKALQKSIDAIRSEKRSHRQAIRQGMLLNQALPLLKHQMLNRLLKAHAVQSAAEKLLHLGIRFDYARYGLVLARIGTVDQAMRDDRQENDLQFFVFENIVQDTLDMPVVCFPHEKNEGEFLIIMGFGPADNPEQRWESIDAPLRRLLVNMRLYGKMPARIAVSPLFRTLESAGAVYRQARETITLMEEGAIRRAAGNGSDDLEAAIVSERQLYSFVKAIERKETAEMARFVHAVFETAPSPRAAAFSVYRALEQAMESLFADPALLPDEMAALYRYINRCAEAAELQDKLVVQAVRIGDLAFKRSQGDSKQMITQARKYIDDNYFEEITLESLAAKFYLNRTYFSALFKQETGWTFKKYLNHVRIGKAKQLLLEHDLRPSVVAELVGIKDQVYFTVLFKKMTGLPPGEYQRQFKGSAEPAISENNPRSLSSPAGKE